VPLRSDGKEVTLLAEYSRRERDILLAGGVLRQLREKGGATASVSRGEDTEPEARRADL
jgi:hypothetical protein